MKFSFIALLILLAAALTSAPSLVETIGPQADGSTVLATGWKIQPVGKQITVGTLPMSSALSPDGKYLLVLNGGYNPPGISVIDTASATELGRTPLGDAWLGLTFSSDGSKVYAGGGSQAKVYELKFAQGKLEPSREFTIVAAAERKHEDFIGDVKVSPDGRMLYAADLFHNRINVINLQSGRVIEQYKTGRRPYRILFHPDGKSFFVSSWADGTIYHHDASTGEQLGLVRVAPHTTDMVWTGRQPDEQEPGQFAGRIFVTAGNTNSVFSIGVTPSKDLRVLESINVATSPRHPLGMTPAAVALDKQETTLYAVCSDANAVAVVDVSAKQSRVRGFVPTGWYPTGARSLDDGRLVVLNGRGLRSFPNPNGPSPLRRAAPVHEGSQVVEYVGRIQTGTLSVIDAFDDDKLGEYSKAVRSLSPYNDNKLEDAMVGPGNPVPNRPGQTSPIQHVIYIVKENRTYDQVLGDIGKGNSDASLTLFGEKVTPNLHKIAREFVLFDNFYVNADVSADGHNWATAAIAPDYVQRMWPNSYAGRRKHYDYEGGEPANTPPAGYLWNNALQAGVPMRNYGFWVTSRATPGPDGEQVETIKDPALVPVTNRKARGFDLDYPDVERAKVFLADLAQFEASGNMSRLTLLRMGNDHTSGLAPGKISPIAAVADNDYAVGMVVEAMSKSKFWASTAIFIVEDDAQNGADHVDSHRSPAFAISPYTHRGIVDSTLYNQASVLRTMELILGLRPMTHFDAGARPMWAAFANQPDAKPYTAEKPRVSLTERNPKAAATVAAMRSARMDFEEADRNDDDELNEILWRAIKKTEPPAPVVSYFSR